jgi:hypothetical protein
VIVSRFRPLPATLASGPGKFRGFADCEKVGGYLEAGGRALSPAGAVDARLGELALV